MGLRYCRTEVFVQKGGIDVPISKTRSQLLRETRKSTAIVCVSCGEKFFPKTSIIDELFCSDCAGYHCRCGVVLIGRGTEKNGWEERLRNRYASIHQLGRHMRVEDRMKELAKQCESPKRPGRCVQCTTRPSKHEDAVWLAATTRRGSGLLYGGELSIVEIEGFRRSAPKPITARALL